MTYSVREPYKEQLTPAPDGATTDFSTSLDYRPGSLSIWRNGVKLDPTADNGFLEIPPATARMKAPPLLGDALWGEYERA
jgi:hypothetical protein